jgi:hypothetical protein
VTSAVTGQTASGTKRTKNPKSTKENTKYKEFWCSRLVLFVILVLIVPKAVGPFSVTAQR